jgi:chromosome segregation ATPase
MSDTSDGKVRVWMFQRATNGAFHNYVLHDEHLALLAERDATIANYQQALEASQRGQQLALAERDATVARLEKNYAASAQACGDYTETIASLRAKNARLRKWIKEKGRHHIACMMLDQYDTGEPYCSCGLDAALALGSEAK